MKILARHKWLAGCTITESNDEIRSTKEQAYRRFTATIRGWRNWLIYEGFVTESTTQFVIDKVRSIRERIDKKDETVFNDWSTRAESRGAR